MLSSPAFKVPIPSTMRDGGLWKYLDLTSSVLVDPASAHVDTTVSSIEKGAVACIQDNATKNGICRMFSLASGVGTNQYARYSLGFRVGFDVASFPSGTDDIMLGIVLTDNNAAGYGNYVTAMIGRDSAGNWLIRRTGTGSAEAEVALASTPAYLIVHCLYRWNGVQTVTACAYDSTGAYINSSILNLPLQMDSQAKLVAGLIVHDRAAVARTISGITLAYHLEVST